MSVYVIVKCVYICYFWTIIVHLNGREICRVHTNTFVDLLTWTIFRIRLTIFRILFCKGQSYFKRCLRKKKNNSLLLPLKCKKLFVSEKKIKIWVATTTSIRYFKRHQYYYYFIHNICFIIGCLNPVLRKQSFVDTVVICPYNR